MGKIVISSAKLPHIKSIFNSPETLDLESTPSVRLSLEVNYEDHGS